MRISKPQIKQFSYYPLIAVRNSFLTIQWTVKNAFFVYINNGIGFKKKQGEKLITHNKSNTFRLIAFGWAGIKVKYLETLTIKVENKVPQAEFTYKKVENTKIANINNIKLNTLESFKNIDQIEFKNKELRFSLYLESLEDEISQLETCNTTEELEKLKDKYHV